MQQLDLQFRTMFAELVQQSIDDRFLSDFPPDGAFVSVSVKGRAYWYYESAMKAGRRARRYVGPASDEAIARRVETFAQLKRNAKARRSLVVALRNVGLPGPDALTGNVVEALSNAGFFRLRGVLVGSVAFQTYAGMLGLRFPAATLQTGDADFAQFHSISGAVEDSLPPLLELLKAVDPTFRDIPDRTDARKTTKYANASKFSVEFLTPNRGSDDHRDRPASMPSLGGASAQALRYLDFLIHEPQRSVLLHKYGIGVTVPAPERYAVHKLIVATNRAGVDSAKRSKDIRQAELLIAAHDQLRLGELLSDALREAAARGPSWRKSLRAGLRMTSPEIQAIAGRWLA